MHSLKSLTYIISRFVTILIRKVSDKRNIHRQLRKYNNYLNTINQLPAPEVNPGKLLIIRLDGIGDYLLFRNFLALYQSSPKWKNYHITLLGEQSWKNFYDTFDSDSTDETIWINKHKYLNDESYRNEVYSLLRQKGFEVVICPCRTRPFLLDDLLVKATGAFKIFGVKNTYKHVKWNRLSNAQYHRLFEYSEQPHEFFFNERFHNWISGDNAHYKRPFIEKETNTPSKENYFLLFIGAAAKSRKWPAEYWIQLIRLIQQNYSIDIVVAGDKNDIEAANQIKAATNAQIIVGETSLKTIALYVKNATAIITNHTMLAHLAVCYGKPVVIISNGDNYYRYTMYNEAGIHNVKIVYSPLFNKWLKKNKPAPLFKEFVAVTKDITTIDPATVFRELNNIFFLLHSDRYNLSQHSVN